MTLLDIFFSSIINSSQSSYVAETKKLNKIKNAFPIFLKNIVFSKWNPGYVYFIFLSEAKSKQENIYLKHNIFSKDFLQYVIDHPNLEFNLKNYYPNIDFDVIKRYIKYRLLTGINTNGYLVSKMLFHTQKEFEKENEFSKLKKSVRKRSGSYQFNVGDKIFKLPIKRIDPYIYRENYGLWELPKVQIERLIGKVFIDIGAFIGDTAMMLKNFHPLKIICYEPDFLNIENLERTIQLNNLTDLVEIRDSALADKPGKMNFLQDNASSKLIIDDSTNDIKKINVSTLDIDFYETDNIGLIKMDVEGFERFVILGGEQLIKKNKPVLLISLYHTGADFFEIPPLLKSYNSNVKLRFIDINPFCPNLGEKILLAYF